MVPPNGMQAYSDNDDARGESNTPPPSSTSCHCNGEGQRCRCRRRKNHRVHFDPSMAIAECEDDQAHFERLHRKFSGHAAASSGFDDTCLEDIKPNTMSEELEVPVRQHVRRTKSCGMAPRTYVSQSLGSHHCSAYRIRIEYHDENLRERCQKNTQKLIQTARDDTNSSSTSALLAKKALKYRRVYERMEGVDINDPAFDVSACLGVKWHRVESD